MKVTDSEKKRRLALAEKQKNRKPDDIHPAFSPRWKHTPTKAVRVPEEFADIVVEIARRLDNQTLSVELLNEAIAEKTERIKQQVLDGLKQAKSE